MTTIEEKRDNLFLRVASFCEANGEVIEETNRGMSYGTVFSFKENDLEIINRVDEHVGYAVDVFSMAIEVKFKGELVMAGKYSVVNNYTSGQAMTNTIPCYVPGKWEDLIK